LKRGKEEECDGKERKELNGKNTKYEAIDIMCQEIDKLRIVFYFCFTRLSSIEPKKIHHERDIHINNTKLL
jgi:hypothetical protein